MKSLKKFILLCTMLIINMVIVIIDINQEELNYIDLIVSIILLTIIIISIEQSPKGIPININLTIDEDELEKKIHDIKD